GGSALEAPAGRPAGTAAGIVPRALRGPGAGPAPHVWRTPLLASERDGDSRAERAFPERRRPPESVERRARPVGRLSPDRAERVAPVLAEHAVVLGALRGADRRRVLRRTVAFRHPGRGKDAHGGRHVWKGN